MTARVLLLLLLAASCTRGAAVADCRSACDNVAKLVVADMKGLPEKELAQVNKELEAATSRCASDCVEEAGSPSVQCVIAAKNMADLRACDPKGTGEAAPSAPK